MGLSYTPSNSLKKNPVVELLDDEEIVKSKPLADNVMPVPYVESIRGIQVAADELQFMRYIAF